jgi:hypothetical protein
MNKLLKDVIARVDSRPEADRAERFELALEIETRHDAPDRAWPEELAGIDCGIKDVGRRSIGSVRGEFRDR